jgi:hypothetical protein
MHSSGGFITQTGHRVTKSTGIIGDGIFNAYVMIMNRSA